ncbi:uncharacterized protein LOC120672535 [Panicum virgatum]|uniref:LysM domain-containing protein n=1 Tax=Panicum virgatum TaxID=38727 RepID=A0A8T0S563_PANVG|nr:uncharacterized protein LOC120672535 [Panicum virgatum]KAG2592208.1 hypothetical protein PVAP13_5NG531600 [Panicum virgatum]
MANHRAAAILTIASLLVAVALTDARLTVQLDKLGRGRVYFASDAVTVPALSCSKVHGVKAGETCFSMAQAARLKQDVFLGFNPNINCENVFVGQWVCLAATSA